MLSMLLNPLEYRQITLIIFKDKKEATCQDLITKYYIYILKNCQKQTFRPSSSVYD